MMEDLAYYLDRAVSENNRAARSLEVNAVTEITGILDLMVLGLEQRLEQIEYMLAN